MTAMLNTPAPLDLHQWPRLPCRRADRFRAAATAAAGFSAAAGFPFACACPERFAGEQGFSCEPGRHVFRVSEQRFVEMTVRVFLRKGVTHRVRPDGTSAVTHRKIVTLYTVLIYDRLRSLDKLLTSRTVLEQVGKGVALEDVAEKVFWITRYPTVALRHKPARLNRDELVRAVRLPDARQTTLLA